MLPDTGMPLVPDAEMSVLWDMEMLVLPDTGMLVLPDTEMPSSAEWGSDPALPRLRLPGAERLSSLREAQWEVDTALLLFSYPQGETVSFPL